MNSIQALIAMNKVIQSILAKRRTSAGHLAPEMVLKDFWEMLESMVDPTPISSMAKKMYYLKMNMTHDYETSLTSPNFFPILESTMDEIRQRNTEIAVETIAAGSLGNLTEEEIRLVIGAVNTKGLFA